MTSGEVAEVRRLEYERSKRILRDSSLLDADFSMDASLYFLTAGVKQ